MHCVISLRPKDTSPILGEDYNVKHQYLPYTRIGQGFLLAQFVLFAIDSLFIGRADPAPTVDSKKQGRNIPPLQFFYLAIVTLVTAI